MVRVQAGQKTAKEMFSNSDSPQFRQFVDLLGDRIDISSHKVSLICLALIRC